MDRWVGKVAVVTGASAGIGASISKRLVEEGLQVVGLARRVERIEELAKICKGSGKLLGFKCDVSKRDDVTKAFKWVKENIGPVQILVNNAGIFRMGKIIDGNPDDWKAVLDLNVMGLSMCSREAFLQIKEANLEGHIVHINSGAGHYVVSGSPTFINMYSPSKHAVTCLTEVMRHEIFDSKCHVRVTSVSPGLVKTEMQNAAGTENPGELYEVRPALNPEDVSDAVAYVISTPSHVNIQELMIKPYGQL